MKINNELKLIFEETKNNNPNMSLDEILYAVYNKIKKQYNKSFDVLRNMILEANNIDELEYYTKNVNPNLKEYIEKNIFPEYEKKRRWSQYCTYSRSHQKNFRNK